MFKSKFFLSVIALCLLSFAAHAQTTLPQAIAMIDAEDFKDAKAALTQLIAADPANAELYYWNGVAKIGLEEWTSAKEDFKAGIKAKPKYPFNHIGLGRVLQHEKNDKDAQIEYDKAKDYNTKAYDANVDIALGYAYLEAGRSRYSDAEVVFTRAQTKDDKNPKSAIALGDYYKSGGVKQLAITQYKKAIDLNPKFVEGYYRLGQLEIAQAEQLQKSRDKELNEERKAKLSEEMKAAYKQGIEYYTKTIELDPNFSPAYRDRAELYFRYDKWVDAAKDYEKYVALQKKDYRAQVRYASFLYLTKEYKKAIDVLEATRKDTTTPVMLRLLGYSQHEMGNPTKGLQYMDEYFKTIDPKYILMDDYMYMGKMNYSLKNVSTAIENYEKAMDKDSSQWRLLIPIVDTLSAQRGRDTSSINKVKFATQEAQLRKLMIDRKLKDVKIPNGRDYYLLGLAYYAANDYKNAETTFRALPTMNEGFYATSAYYWLAKVIRDNKLNKYGDAAEAYEFLIAALNKKDKLDAYEKDYGARAATYLAYWKGDPMSTNDLNCEAAAPYIATGLMFAPDNKTLSDLAAYCTTPYDMVLQNLAKKTKLEQADKDFAAKIAINMANLKANPTNAAGVFNCELAKPYITQGLALAPDNQALKDLAAKCP